MHFVYSLFLYGLIDNEDTTYGETRIQDLFNLAYRKTQHLIQGYAN